MPKILDRSLIGKAFEPFDVMVEAGRLRLFAKATGNDDPVFTDEAVAKSRGYRSIPAPPTYVFTLEMERADPFDYLDLLEIDPGTILHGEQSFDYHQTVCAGDVLTFENVIADIYDKKNGALQFLVLETKVTDSQGAAVAEMRRSIVVR
ncbi:MAG: MaoC family dehydratase N-terminal domain-containing protein [Sphingomonadaceae bacterium]|nr:MaoC family dehydratase N-terminal domain-containing protein [Sphingomonadaceae bacterium]